MTPERKAQIGWVTYDFADTIFSMNILTFYFSPWIILTLGVSDIYYSISYSLSMVMVAVTMPGLGRIADQTGGKLKGLRMFTTLCVLSTVLISLVAMIHPGLMTTATLALILFSFASYFYGGSITYYNSLLSDVSSPDNAGKISGLGAGLGYIGAIVGLLLVTPITEGKLIPGISGREYAFLPTALLFMLFALPAFNWIKERGTKHSPPLGEKFFRRLWTTLQETRNYPGALRFLISDYLIEDAIATTVVFMAVYAEAVVGFKDNDKVILFIASTSFAFLGSFLFGWISDRIRSKNALLIALLGWVIVLGISVLITAKQPFYIIGAFVGVFLGAVRTTTRPLLNSLVPKEKLGQFYGLFTFSGKTAATMGPLIWGLIVLIGKRDMPLGKAALHFLSFVGVDVTETLAATIHYRLALASLLVSMLAGFIMLLRVPSRRHYQDDHN